MRCPPQVSWSVSAHEYADPRSCLGACSACLVVDLSGDPSDHPRTDVAGRSQAGFARIRRTIVRWCSSLRRSPEQPIFRFCAGGELPACLRTPRRECAVRPAARSLRHNRDLRFGGLWRPTPLAFADTAALEPVERCVAYVGRSLSAEIGRVLREPGAQYYRDLTDGTLHLYAPAARLAGRVRIASEGRP